MIDNNGAIEQAFYTALTAELTPLSVPVFINYAPNELLTDSYVELSIVSSSENSNMNAAYSETIVSVKIFTKETSINNGVSANTIAGHIYEAITPSNLSTMSINGKDAVVSLLSDINQGLNLSQDEYYINRFVTFTLKNIFNS